MASIHDILRPITYTKTISRLSAAGSSLLNFFGMQPGGPNEKFYGHGREGSYNIFNNLRSNALETAPGAPAARRPRQNVGRVPFVYPRMHEEFSLLSEEIHNLAKIDDPRMRDVAGEAYIMRQSRGPAQRHSNWRTSQLVGMLRDSLYLHESGGYWYINFTSSGALEQRTFDFPAGNKGQLNILDLAGNSINGSAIIDKEWSDTGANIPLHCQLIDAALFRRHGVHLSHIFVRTQQWNNVCNNDYVAIGAGISNPPFQNFVRTVGENPDGSPRQEWTATVNNVPGVTWHIHNEGRDVGYPGNESWAYDIEENGALFLPEPSGELFEGLLGSEPIREYDNGPESVKIGLAAWTKGSSNPTGYENFILDNFLPVPYMPGCWCYGTVDDFE